MGQDAKSSTTNNTNQSLFNGLYLEMPTAVSINCKKEKLQLSIAALFCIPAFRRKRQEDDRDQPEPSKTLPHRKPDFRNNIW